MYGKLVIKMLPETDRAPVVLVDNHFPGIPSYGLATFDIDFFTKSSRGFDVHFTSVSLCLLA